MTRDSPEEFDREARPVSAEAIRRAAAAIAGIALRTPLIEAPALSEAAGVAIWLKCEQLQPMGAFKIRGAAAALAQLPPGVRGVVTHSSGNHGQAVALAASRLGLRAVVVMPEGAARIKVEGVRHFGGEVELVRTPDERDSRARELAARDGLALIPPYEYPDVIAGQATCGVEILEQLPEVTTILAPVGGGGLLAGTAAAVLAFQPAVRVIGVEPAGLPKLSAALAAGHPVVLERIESLADGLLPPALGDLPFRQLTGVVREAVAVTDDDLRRTVRWLFRMMGLRTEPSGAAAAAALLMGRCRVRGPAVAIVSGGNVDPERFEELIA